MGKKASFFNLCVLFAVFLFIAGIVTAIMYPVFGGLAKFLVMFFGGLVLFVITLIIWNCIGKILWVQEEEHINGTAILFFAIGFFFLSWLNLPGHGYSAITVNDETKLVEWSYFGSPYDKDFVRIANKKHDMTVNVEMNEDFMVWDVSVKLKLIASYDEAFELLALHGSADHWLDKVEKVSEEAMEMVVAENVSPRKSGWQLFGVSEEYEDQLRQLGYEAQEVRMGNLRYVQNASRQ